LWARSKMKTWQAENRMTTGRRWWLGQRLSTPCGKAGGSFAGRVVRTWRATPGRGPTAGSGALVGAGLVLHTSSGSVGERVDVVAARLRRASPVCAGMSSRSRTRTRLNAPASPRGGSGSLRFLVQSRGRGRAAPSSDRGRPQRECCPVPWLHSGGRPAVITPIRAIAGSTALRGRTRTV
jgi:hypothetical protein